jgi:hypothetical protein
VYGFERSLPQDYPDDWKQRVQVVEDGDEQTLYIDYADRSFVRPMAPWTAQDVREEYGRQQEGASK